MVNHSTQTINTQKNLIDTHKVSLSVLLSASTIACEAYKRNNKPLVKTMSLFATSNLLSIFLKELESRFKRNNFDYGIDTKHKIRKSIIKWGLTASSGMSMTSSGMSIMNALSDPIKKHQIAPFIAPSSFMILSAIKLMSLHNRFKNDTQKNLVMSLGLLGGLVGTGVLNNQLHKGGMVISANSTLPVMGAIFKEILDTYSNQTNNHAENLIV